MRRIFLLLIFHSIVTHAQYHKHVNPFIGTGGHGHTFPGPTMPHGMVQLSPDTRIDGSWDGCSGYHYSDKVIYGFSHTHLNGTGVSDYGDIMLMPTLGKPKLEPSGYASSFSHTNEKASAGYYAVKLDNGVRVELTSSMRVGVHRYTFERSGVLNLVLDLNHRDQLLQGDVRIIDSKTIEVYRNSSAWAADQHIFARIEFSEPMTVSAVNNNGFMPAKTIDKFFSGNVLALSFSKKVRKGAKLLVKVSLSTTGYQGAKLNMTEVPHWDFDKVRRDAEQAWDKELAKIDIQESDNQRLVVFYTAMYHALMQPNIAQDIDGHYRGRDNQIHKAEGFDYYSVFSLWDTFRAAHPLYTLIDRKRTADYINTFIKQYEQGGRLPVWEFASNETDCMIGYHSVSVIADAMAKGIRGFDYEKAYEAAKHSAMLDHLGLEAYKKNGFISIDDEHESVSKTLEYAYDDWCIAQMALLLDKPQDYAYFSQRSQYWKNLFDPQTRFIRPKRNAGWDNPFDPREVNNNYTEGNGWQYTFFVPQDVPGMIDAFGGPNAFEKKLDEMFESPATTTGREQVDITGLIGQYAHGNEPSHHMAWLYEAVGKPEKAKQKIKYILNEFYTNAPDGLIGNEDCGQMSAWYILSTLGMYNIAPGSLKTPWTFIGPSVREATIHFEDGRSQTITKDTPASQILQLGTEPRSYSVFLKEELVTVPVITGDSKSFSGSARVAITHADKTARIFYAKGGKDQKFQPYLQPLELMESASIDAYAQVGEQRSHVVTANYFKRPNNFDIRLNATYNAQYHAGGPSGLLDGIKGTTNWRKGDWQGYQATDFECIIDMKQLARVSAVQANFLQDSRSWILMPVQVDFYTSSDGVAYTLAGSVIPGVDPKNTENIIQEYSVTTDNVARYIKVVAKNFGPLPEWHQGKGGQAFIFIDEITIK
jgi:predicted alpha-1,2-mannosidase